MIPTDTVQLQQREFMDIMRMRKGHAVSSRRRKLPVCRRVEVEEDRRSGNDPRARIRELSVEIRRLKTTRRVQEAADRRKREDEQRKSDITRKLVEELKRRNLNTIAERIKKTRLVEPILALVAFFFSGLANFVTMGSMGIGLLIVLYIHERGHSRAVRKEGYTPNRFWAIPFVGALMELPPMSSVLAKARVAYGGPLDGFYFTLAVTALWITQTFFTPHSVNEMGNVLYTTAFVSIIFNAFNLLPLYPLDGGRIIKVMGRSWLKLLRILGFFLLGALIIATQHATLLIIGIVVLDDFLAMFDRKGDQPEERSLKNIRMRFLLGVLFLSVSSAVVLWKIHLGSLSGWELIGEFAYIAFGARFVQSYYKEWKHPEDYQPGADEANESEEAISACDVAAIVKRYFGLIAAYALLGGVLFFLYLSRGHA